MHVELEGLLALGVDMTSNIWLYEQVVWRQVWAGFQEVGETSLKLHDEAKEMNGGSVCSGMNDTERTEKPFFMNIFHLYSASIEQPSVRCEY